MGIDRNFLKYTFLPGNIGFASMVSAGFVASNVEDILTTKIRLVGLGSLRFRF
jgi:hypothetical protein